MELYDVIKKRYSCRKYIDKPLPKELIEKIMSEIRWAPSAVNFQPWKFLILTEKARIQKLQEAYDRDWFLDAPVIIIACALKDEAYVRKYDDKNYAWVDVSIIFDHLTLAATNEGLGTCWIGAFKNDMVKDILGLPENVDIVAMTPLGYPGNTAQEKKRKELSEILCWEEWK